MPLVTSGVEHGNLRELALARMKDHGTQVSITRIQVNYNPVDFERGGKETRVLSIMKTWFWRSLGVLQPF